MCLIEGVEFLDYSVHSDFRGDLVAFEEDDSLPFALRRVFFINVDCPEVERGGHANSCDEFIISLRGEVSVDVDNGYQQARALLKQNERGLWVRPGILITLSRFKPGTLLLVFASAPYSQTRHYNCAMPQLFTVYTPA